ncbi:MAG: hypothetical protein AW11_02896 [Candidatus Accumulibacter regalis]|jgi:hypothetical protein|uniref:Uncharacterized protein n=1 Tax=Accumulibacter regalis TaxID=522306 RepID=A0A011NW15_ACCRE|nr:hypothetical protein [Accumulibacter sp.]EXI86903.1 MAG: hypothetical protein AW11_02896 [Candidatus Accumulibacter regalis]HRE72720.1 hypothetical protein [Accumulibacter sp.]
MPDIFAVYNPLRKWKKGDLPGDPIISIVLNEIWTNNEGRIAVTATLANDSEIDYAIDKLQKDLESVRKESKHVLKTQNEKMRVSLL